MVWAKGEYRQKKKYSIKEGNRGKVGEAIQEDGRSNTVGE